MDREMRKALLSRARYDWDTHDATRRRNAEQVKRSRAGPQAFPLTTNSVRRSSSVPWSTRSGCCPMPRVG